MRCAFCGKEMQVNIDEIKNGRAVALPVGNEHIWFCSLAHRDEYKDRYTKGFYYGYPIYYTQGLYRPYWNAPVGYTTMQTCFNSLIDDITERDITYVKRNK